MMHLAAAAAAAAFLRTCFPGWAEEHAGGVAGLMGSCSVAGEPAGEGWIGGGEFV